jgi:hypothetical protein
MHIVGAPSWLYSVFFFKTPGIHAHLAVRASYVRSAGGRLGYGIVRTIRLWRAGVGTFQLWGGQTRTNIGLCNAGVV